MNLSIISGRPPKNIEIDEPTPSSVVNITCALADTEYSYSLPSGTKKIFIKTRNYNDVKYTFVSGESGSKYITLNSGMSDVQTGNFSNKTIYVQSPTAGAVIEILCYQ